MASTRGPGSRRSGADRLVRRLRGLRRDRRGVVALEFAITGVAFFGLVLFVIALGYRMYIQVALDYASSRASRLLAVDSTQSRSSSASTFQAVTFCPLLSPFIACSNVTIGLRQVSDYRNVSALGAGPPPFSPGQGGSLMLLQVIYRAPALSWPLPGGSGGTGTFLSSTVTVGYPFQNEY